MWLNWISEGDAGARRMSAVIVAECEAFLEGKFAESAVPAGELVPVWAWINLLAHGTEDQLRREVMMPASVDDWHRTERCLQPDCSPLRMPATRR